MNNPQYEASNYSMSKISEIISSLPKHVQNCLEFAGLDSPEAFIELKDLSLLISYIRENGERLKRYDPEQANVVLGMYMDEPKEFSLNAGHTILLSKAIEKCKQMMKFYKKTDSMKMLPTSSVSTENTNQVLLPKISSEIDCDTSTVINNLISNITDINSKNIPENSVPVNPVENLSEIVQSLRVNINKWKSKMPAPMCSLQEGKHYSIEATATKKFVRCLLCGQILACHKVKYSYVFSNYSRHVKKNCPVLTVKMKKRNRIMLEVSNTPPEKEFNLSKFLPEMEFIPLPGCSDDVVIISEGTSK